MVAKKVLSRKAAKRFKKKKVPFGARPDGILDPERYPVKPKVPGTRDTGFPAPQRRKKHRGRAPRVK